MQTLLNNIRRDSLGFTIVEMVVVVTVLGLLTPIVLMTMGDLYSSNIVSIGQSTQNTDTLGVLRSIESELSHTIGWDTSLSVNTPLGPTNSTSSQETWSYCGTGGTTDCTKAVNRVLIAYTIATDKATSDPSRLPVFSATLGSCNTAGPINPINVAQIYFVAPDPKNANQNDLYRRTVVSPGGDIPCNGTPPFQNTTCAQSVASNPRCRDSKGQGHTDAILLTNIKSFNVDYFSTSNGVVIVSPYTAASSLIANAQTIKITVTTELLINGKLNQNTADIRIDHTY